jgi:N-acetylglucosaminyldiphosphoundecaprenol N-acetyl-beta-D-mannosaminyltransferase
MQNEDTTTNQNVTVEKAWIGDCFVSKISMSELLSLVNEWIEKDQKNKCITAINASKLVMSQKDKKLADYVLNSSINIGDGISIYLATLLIGDPIPERIAGADLMIQLLKLANEHSYKIFFLGSRQDVLERVIDKCQAQYPNVKIAGIRNGYFKKDEKDAVVREIASASPAILLVALGLPQKEYFVADYGGLLNSSVIVPVGGTFDVYAGVKKRAPQWVQRLGIEWLWRSAYDRSRARLVFKSLFPFILILIKEMYRQLILKKRKVIVC